MLLFKNSHFIILLEENSAQTDGYQIQSPSSPLTCLWGPLSMCALAPSQAVLIASSDGVPKRSVIKSNYEETRSTDG